MAAFAGVRIDNAHQFITIAIGIDHFYLFAAQIPAQHCRATRLQGGLVHIEFIGIDRALHHHLAQAVAAGDKNHITKTAFRIQRKHDAAGADIGTHHFLDAGGKSHVAMVEALVLAVGNGPVIEQRGEHLAYFQLDVIQPRDIEKSLLLAGKRSVGQVFRRGRRSHCPGHFFSIFLD